MPEPTETIPRAPAGPKSSTERRVATVYGATGFIGRYVVNRLAHLGYIVRAAGRDTEAAMVLKPMGAVGQIVPTYAPVTDAAAVHRAADGADVIVSLVGILAEPRPGAFEAIQHRGAATIAAAAARAGATLVHVSAIGADPASPSGYASSKGRGEAAVRDALPGAVILRPSLVFGAEDKFFNRFAAMAQISPVMPVIEGDTKFQPVFVGDVAGAVIAGLTRQDAVGGVFELGGPRVWTFRELLVWLLHEIRRRRPLVAIPPGLARIQADILQRLPGKLLTRDQLLLLGKDNVVAPGARDLASLGITATPVELIMPDILARYRPGGRKRDGVRPG